MKYFRWIDVLLLVAVLLFLFTIYLSITTEIQHAEQKGECIARQGEAVRTSSKTICLDQRAFK